jgi:hypothetical protein
LKRPRTFTEMKSMSSALLSGTNRVGVAYVSGEVLENLEVFFSGCEERNEVYLEILSPHEKSEFPLHTTISWKAYKYVE